MAKIDVAFTITLEFTEYEERVAWGKNSYLSKIFEKIEALQYEAFSEGKTVPTVGCLGIRRYRFTFFEFEQFVEFKLFLHRTRAPKVS